MVFSVENLNKKFSPVGSSNERFNEKYFTTKAFKLFFYKYN